MIKPIIATFILMLSLVSLFAGQSEMDKFMESRPSYKKSDDQEVKSRFGFYFSDSAYTPVREGVTIAVFSIKGEILGYDILVTKNVSAIGVSDIQKTINSILRGIHPGIAIYRK